MLSDRRETYGGNVITEIQDGMHNLRSNTDRQVLAAIVSIQLPFIQNMP